MNKLTNFIINFFLIVAIVDAGNIFLGIKTPLFVLTIGYLLCRHRKNLDLNFLIYFLILLGISAICYVCGRLYNYNYDNAFLIQYTFSFSMLLLLLWHRYYDLRYGLWISSILLVVITIGGFYVSFINPALNEILLRYSENASGIPVIYISSREFLGLTFDGVFYTPLMFVVLPCAIAIYNVCKSVHKTKYLIIALILTLALFCGGNRACLMSIVILWFGVGGYFLLKKFAYLKLLILPIAVVLIFILFYKLISEQETSNDIKGLHLLSYVQLLHDNPLAFITGTGAGTLIYSYGFESETPLMEWTYIELFRLYGLFAIYILFVFYSPGIQLIRKNKYYKYGLPMGIGSCLYMLSAYGNPYLMNSTGFSVLIFTYWYFKKYKINFVSKNIHTGKRRKLGCQNRLKNSMYVPQ